MVVNITVRGAPVVARVVVQVRKGLGGVIYGART